MTTSGYRIASILVLTITLGVSAGCGQKGDLYLPDKPVKQQDYVAPEKR